MRVTDKQRDAFAKLLRDARESRGWKQYEAAERVGIPATTLSRLEHGPYDGMRFEDLARLAHTYGIALEVFAALVGLSAEEPQEGNGEVGTLIATVRSLEPDQRAFVVRVLQAVLKGM